MITGKKNEPKARRHAGYILKSKNQQNSSDLKTNSTSDISNPNSVPKRLYHINPRWFPANTSLVPKKPPLNLNIKSVSLIELSETVKPLMEKMELFGKGDCQEALEVTFQTKQIYFWKSYRECKLARKVYSVFVLNAWRQQKKQVLELKQYRSKLKKEVENLNLQIILLTNLFQSETLRVTVARSDASHLRNQLERELRVVQDLKEELNSLSFEKEDWLNTKQRLDCNLALLKKQINEMEDKLNESANTNRIYKKELEKIRGHEYELLAKLEEAEGISKKKDIAFNILKNKYLSYKEKINVLAARNQELENTTTSQEKQLESCNSLLAKQDVDLNNWQNTAQVNNLKIKELSVSITEMDLKLKTSEELRDKLELIVETNRKEKENYHKNCKDVTFICFKIFLHLFGPQVF